MLWRIWCICGMAISKQIIHDFKTETIHRWSILEAWGIQTVFIATKFIAKFWKVFVNSNKLLKVATFFDGRYQGKFLKIFLKNLLAFIDQSIATVARDRIFLLPCSYHFFCELYWRLRELNVGILVDQLFMKKTESFILLTHYPLFLVELNIYHILCVLAIINGVVINSCWLYCERERNLEEKSSIKSVVLTASFNMLYKNLSWEEYLTKLALHWLRMFKDSLK